MIRDLVYQKLSFVPDIAEYRTAIRYDLMEDELKATADCLADYAVKNLKPVIAGAVADITLFNPDADPVEVSVEGTVFRGKILARLEGAKTVIPYYLSAGDAFTYFDFSSADPLAAFYAGYLKEQALEYARKIAISLFSGILNSHSVSSLNPGSGDTEQWDITELTKLFRLLKETGCRIDVTLTDSCLIIPDKSIAGIFYPTEKELFSCSACTRTACPSRRESIL